MLLQEHVPLSVGSALRYPYVSYSLASYSLVALPETVRSSFKTFRRLFSPLSQAYLRACMYVHESCVSAAQRPWAGTMRSFTPCAGKRGRNHRSQHSSALSRYAGSTPFHKASVSTGRRRLRCLQLVASCSSAASKSCQRVRFTFTGRVPSTP